MTGQAKFVDGRWNGRTVRDWIPDVVRSVVTGFDPAAIIVFGSVGRGDEQTTSDLDLLVVFDSLDPLERRSLMGKIRRSIDAPIPIDVLVTDVEEFEARRGVNGSPYFWPALEGRDRLRARCRLKPGDGDEKPKRSSSRCSPQREE